MRQFHQGLKSDHHALFACGAGFLYVGAMIPEILHISATDAKNEFGSLLERVIQGAAVVITKRDAPKAVLISIDEFDALSRAPARRSSTR